MEKIILIGIIFVGIIPLSFSEVLIQNDQKYVGDDGSLHIVGEIINNSEIPLNQISISTTLLDENKNEIQTIDTNSLVNTIMPGMKGPFDLIVSSKGIEKIESYSLKIDYKVSPPKNQVIDITDSELTRDKFNNLIITGTVSNKGDITANTVSVIATIYDKKGNVAAVSRVHPEPDYLRINDKAFFVIPIQDKGQTNEIGSYTLIAESEEFAAVTEFPISTLILLTITLGAYIGITRFSGRVITNLISATNLK